MQARRTITAAAAFTSTSLGTTRSDRNWHDRAMARPRQKNIVERLTGAGEDALQKIGGAAGADRVLGALGTLRGRVDELQKSVRSIDKLEKRLSGIERRLDKLEGTGSTTRKKSASKKSAAARKPSGSS
jgi:hypothetical protein